MYELIILLLLLALTLTLLAVWVALGHAIWLAAAWFFRQVFTWKSSPAPVTPIPKNICPNCRYVSSERFTFCPTCGAPCATGAVDHLLKDLTTTEQQLSRLVEAGKLDEKIYAELKTQVDAERQRLEHPLPSGEQVRKEPTPEVVGVESEPIAVVTASDNAIVIEPVIALRASERPGVVVPEPKREPPRPFAEVLNSFMEQSNIRWGEIIGGLLIIGCSTALTVSLWAEISRTPVLKFLIFTTVTAVLFGIGLYTEHRWKLPTTSRGILTIATLLVPLNFLAIAAVSSNTTSGTLVVGSELLAPAIFFCLVYFAGRVIAPRCAHLLAAGILGSSIGQLLVRHFASTDMAPALLILLGAFPVTCYLVTVGIAARLLFTEPTDEAGDASDIFTMLGTMSFAALLPFGLLLYKAGPVGLTMMYLAPIVSLWGLPMLAVGTLLWRFMQRKEVVTLRTTGTAIGVLGVMIVLAGMVLAWPNPASLVPTALLNFAIFTALAVALNLPAAHLLAAGCFALAYLVVFHVLAGGITWQNLRVMSLLDVTLSARSGQALTGTFAMFLIASDWLKRKGIVAAGYYYFLAALGTAALSLFLVTVLGYWPTGNYSIWFVYAVCTAGALWVAFERRSQLFSWLGSSLLFVTFGRAFTELSTVSFPWQTALLLHASILVMAGIVLSRDREHETLWRPLSQSALLSSFFAVVALIQGNEWEVTAMQAERVFWIAGIWLAALWIFRRRDLFTAFQFALTVGVVLATKAALQQYEWYAYLPHAFLHPTALQIQGVMLVLLCLVWTAARLLARRAVLKNEPTRDTWSAAWELLDTKHSIDQIVSLVLVGGFLLLTLYGAMSGLTRELAARDNDYSGWNIAGFPHHEAVGAGSWILLGLLTILMLANMWERRRAIYLGGALATVYGMVSLGAGLFESQTATATAWRWLSALFLLGASVVLWYRDRIAWPRLEKTGDELAAQARTLLFTLTLVPLIVLTAYPALRSIYYLPVHSPTSGIFALIDDEFSYSVPLVIVALVFVGYSIRERVADYAMAGGIWLNASASIGYLLSVVAVHGAMDRVVLTRVIQLNGITTSVYGLAWLSLLSRWRSSLSRPTSDAAKFWLRVQTAIAIGLIAIFVAPALISLVFWPQDAGKGTFVAGDVVAWLSVLSAMGLHFWFVRARGEKLTVGKLAVALIVLGCLLAFTFADWNTVNWSGLHVLTLASAALAWLMLLASLPVAHSGSFRKIFAVEGYWTEGARRWSAALGIATAFLALRATGNTSASSWWVIVPLLMIAALFATLNWLTLKLRYIYGAGILFNLAVSIWWLDVVTNNLSSSTAFLEVNITAACLGCLLWMYLELRARRLSEAERSGIAYHHLVAIISSVVLLLIVWSHSYGAPLVAPSGLGWFAIVSLTALLIASLWDPKARYAVGGLYFVTILAGVALFEQLDLPRTRFLWSFAMLLAICALSSSLLWRQRGRVLKICRQLGIPGRLDPEVAELRWLLVVNTLAVAITVITAYWIDLRFVRFGMRWTSALAVGAQAVTFGLLAEGKWRGRRQRTAIVLFMIGALFLGWSWLTPGENSTWLNRGVIVMVVMFGAVALHALVLDKEKVRWPDWMEAARASVPWILGAGAVALAGCLLTEISYQIQFGIVRINTLSLITIGVVLATAVVVCVLFALSPAHDPLSLSDRGRMNYVYTAELFLALLFLHVRLTLPWLFTGFLEHYWPFIVMAIAYLGVVTSESLRRKNLLVLAHPLERTGVFLPLLPVLGFWLAQSEVDYSTLLFVVGGLYALLSLLRRSFMFGVLAAIAGNGGLWYLLHHTVDYQFLQHPQLWLIPVALSVLLAAYLNEESLNEDQMAGVRYLSLVTIYASSTADIFINGVSNSPWLPLLLGAFSLAGVFAGIIFRIRGLLLLGSVFLLLAIVTMIWYASVNLGWTWLWYVAGIVTGATIIFMFAVFEKKRSEVLRVVEGLKEWER